MVFLDSLRGWVSGYGYGDPSELASGEIQHLERLVAHAKRGDPNLAAERWARANLPVFVYFGDYSTLDSRIHLPSYLASEHDPGLSKRTQTALFDRSGIDPRRILHLGRPRDNNETEEAVHRRIEERSHLLKSASSRLTGDWIEWWTERRHDFHLEVDGEYIVLKVSDEYSRSPIPFEERSHGLRWFFSFYLVFLAEAEKSHKRAILLLDEPGLYLHPALQARLLKLFETISKSNQLIYTTHLPFLVDGDHLERVRTLYLAGPEPHTARVSDSLRMEGDRDTLLPIQAALGYSIAQTLFVGKRSLIVEGITDYWIIKSLSACFATVTGSTILEEDTVVIPAGGTKHIMPLASIMIASTGVGKGRSLVLLDSDNDGWSAAERLEKSFKGDSEVLMLGTALELAEATIEDLVPRDEYAGAVRRAGYEFELDETARTAATNVQALRHAFQRAGRGKFGVTEKVLTALEIIRTWGVDPDSLPNLTRARATALFEAINRGFDGSRVA